uniref:N,N-dimethylformamidase alpha subunit n=1 Tax=Paracoccus aminophilus TaxID=34003 RepID=DMFAA_PARAH|nr:N,N-dimethylformamidase subunit alpha [Paracoccus aminophilus]C9DQ22.1 RecName: Full=N,N-dimethylformamidase alpha subunit; AltName: Full=N,N-dimethylformamidase light chain [Paracoccus aminophilus]ACV81785.1 DmfA1 [Paracoccus aminophilus JCM 7686]
MNQRRENYVSDPSAYPDRSADWYEYFDRKRREEIIEIIDSHPEIIDEHERNPFGYRNHPSPHLQRVHNYFRMQPTFGKYYIYTEREWSSYRIAEIREFGKLPVLTDDSFATEEEAMHAVFLKRIEDVRNELSQAEQREIAN